MEKIAGENTNVLNLEEKFADMIILNHNLIEI
jgi:hypothetical protein